MTLSRTSLFFIVAAAFSCSDKESEEPWGLTGTVQGKVFLYNEYGATEPDQGGAVVTFQSGSTNKSVTTDSDGKFIADDIPMGTYNLVLEKPGFASKTITGTRVVGGKNPMYTITSMSRPSTTKVTGLAAVSVLNSAITFTGTVIHNNSVPYAWVYYAVFIGSTADVSPTKYAQSSLYYTSQSSGSSFSNSVHVDYNKFPSGSTAYIVAYGSTNSYAYDLQTQLYVYNGLGATPSNVTSIVVP